MIDMQLLNDTLTSFAIIIGSVVAIAMAILAVAAVVTRRHGSAAAAPAMTPAQAHERLDRELVLR
jgi:hypothetical protein